jgi:hypothetical protein
MDGFGIKPTFLAPWVSVEEDILARRDAFSFSLFTQMLFFFAARLLDVSAIYAQ